VIAGIDPKHWPTREDIQSPAFARLSAALEDRINHLRVENDSPQMDELKTARHRGRIAELKELLALVNPPAPAREADRDEPSAPRPAKGTAWNDLT